jgi:hypothetical protein
MGNIREDLKRAAKRHQSPGFRRIYRWINRARGRPSLPQTCADATPGECTGTPTPPLLFSARRGLYLVENARVRRLLRGRYFGLTRREERWFVFQCVHPLFGQLLSFELSNGRLRDLHVEILHLSPGVHQVDFLGDALLVTDTETNCLRLFERHRSAWRLGRTVYPRGRLHAGSKSSNYLHLNSVIADGTSVLALCHNHTHRTGRPSEILLLDAELACTSSRAIDASCAHNIAAFDGSIAFCDSMRGDIVLGDRRIALGPFTRGLAVGREQVVVGGSEFASRVMRADTAGFLYVLDRQGVPQGTTHMPEVGGVYDIRLIAEPDLAMSAVLQAQTAGCLAALLQAMPSAPPSKPQAACARDPQSRNGAASEAPHGAGDCVQTPR